MAFTISVQTGLWDAPNGALISVLNAGLTIETDATRVDKDYIFAMAPDAGWVLRTDCEPEGWGETATEDGYVRAAISFEMSANGRPETAPWFISADMLLARRDIESKPESSLALLGSAGGLGPLRMLAPEWDGFLAVEGTGEGYLPEHRRHPIMQLRAAARRLVEDARAISRVANEALPADDEPFLPSYLDLFHCYLTESPEAALALRKLDDLRVASPNDTALRQTFAQVLAPHLDTPALKRLITSRSVFSSLMPISHILDQTTNALTEGLKAGFELIKFHAPEDLPIFRSGDAPWFDKAMTYEPRKLSETADKAELISFFDATDHGKPTTLPHWCGAFVAHCLKSTPGVDIAVPPGSARAANWRGWGQTISPQSNDVPQGAVVVLSPEPGTNTSGHVAFFDRFDDKGGVSLLGGNQSDTVNYTVFRRSRIVHIGWPDTHDRIMAQAGQGAPSNRSISDKAFDAIIGFEVTSQQRYESRYRRPIWPGGRSGVTIGIGYDLGQQEKATIEKDWKGLISKEMIAAATECAGITGASARDLAKKVAARIDVPWEVALAVHRDKVLPRFIGLVERNLDNVSQLSGDSLGALVSLTFNRGASYRKIGERYREMRKIRTAMLDKETFKLIPGLIRDMQWIWPDSEGLKARRRAEADLFQQGLP